MQGAATTDKPEPWCVRPRLVDHQFPGPRGKQAIGQAVHRMVSGGTRVEELLKIAGQLIDVGHIRQIRRLTHCLDAGCPPWDHRPAG